jgi:IrrE N-terminal-like domain
LNAEFIPRARIDARAADLWRREGLTVGFDCERLLDRLGLNLVWDSIPEGPGERILGALQPVDKLVVLNESRLAELEENEGLRRFTVGHEVGHWFLHASDARAGQLTLDNAGRTWCRSGSTASPERQAEMYASSLLIPEDHLRATLPGAPRGGWPEIYVLAERFVVTPTAMIIRLEELGLYHRNRDGVPVIGRPRDERQGTLFG